MPPFGSRRARPSEAPSSEPDPQPVEPSAEQRLVDLLAERAEIERELDGHREQRERWLADGGDLERIIALGAQDDRLKLRLQQIDALLPAIREALDQEREAARAAWWQRLAPELAAAERDTAEAIRAYTEASERYRRLHWHATQAGFDAELRAGFVTPPHYQINPYVFSTFLAAVDQRGRSPALAPSMLVEIDHAAGITAAPQFKPRRVPVAEIEAISAIAEPRRVRILHGPVRTANLQIGISRMHPGETHTVGARAAHALVASGVAEYADQIETAAA